VLEPASRRDWPSHNIDGLPTSHCINNSLSGYKADFGREAAAGAAEFTACRFLDTRLKLKRRVPRTASAYAERWPGSEPELGHQAVILSLSWKAGCACRNASMVPKRRTYSKFFSSVRMKRSAAIPFRPPHESRRTRDPGKPQFILECPRGGLASMVVANRQA
jgi:hypothetical protein